MGQRRRIHQSLLTKQETPGEGQGPSFVNGCKEVLSGRVQVICPGDGQQQEAEGEAPAHFCWSHLHLPPSPYTFPPASSKTGSLIRSLCPHSGSNPPASRWCSGSLRIMRSRVRLRLLVGSKATVMATGLCHIAQEAMKNPDSLWHSEWGIRCL